MLPEKLWDAEAIVRLFARVLICVFIGAVVSSVAGFLRAPKGAHELEILALAAGALAAFAASLAMLRRPWRIETFPRNAGFLMLWFYAGLFLTWSCVRLRGPGADVETSAANMVIAVLAFQGSALVLIRGFLREHGIGWAEAFGFRRRLGRSLLIGIAVGIAFLYVGWQLQWICDAVLQRIHVQPHEQQAVKVLRSAESLASRFLLGVSAVLIAPAAEETLFRGILYPAIKQRGFPRLALWGTSLLFGAIHLNLATFLPLTLLALCLVWLYENTGNLLGPIAAHAMFNALNFAAVFVSEAISRSAPHS